MSFCLGNKLIPFSGSSHCPFLDLGVIIFWWGDVVAALLHDLGMAQRCSALYMLLQVEQCCWVGEGGCVSTDGSAFRPPGEDSSAQSLSTTKEQPDKRPEAPTSAPHNLLHFFTCASQYL